MISRIFRVGVVCFVIAFGISAFAQLKIAAVSATTAIFGTEEGEAKQAEWEKEAQPEIDLLNKLQDEVNALSERYRKDVDILTENEKTALELEIESKSNRHTNLRQQLSNDQSTKAQLYYREQLPLFQTVMNDLIAIEGYDAVFSLDTQVPVFLHLNQKHIITAKVIEKLNERMKENDELPDELTEEPTEQEESDESTEGGE